VLEWQAAPPAWKPSATQILTLPLEQGVELLAEIKPAREENRWFLLCSFQATEPGTPQRTAERMSQHHSPSKGATGWTDSAIGHRSSGISIRLRSACRAYDEMYLAS
jgi:hypothetical protein